MSLIDWVIVRSTNESKRTPPKTFLPRSAAQELYDAGLATWNNRATVLTMKKIEAEMWRPAPSLKPNERVMSDFVLGKSYAVAIMESWA